MSENACFKVQLAGPTKLKDIPFTIAFGTGKHQILTSEKLDGAMKCFQFYLVNN